VKESKYIERRMGGEGGEGGGGKIEALICVECEYSFEECLFTSADLYNLHIQTMMWPTTMISPPM